MYFVLNQSARPQLRTNRPPSYHLTCRQLQKMKIERNGVTLNNSPVDQVILIARIVSSTKGTSPRGLPVSNLLLEDSTGRCRVVLYEALTVDEGGYYKVVVSARVMGPVYRPELKLMSFGMVVLEDYSELTEHFLECMSSEQILASI